MFCGIHIRVISQKVLMNSIHSMCLEIRLKITTTSPRYQGAYADDVGDEDY